MDLDPYLEILILVDSGETTIDEVAAATGLPFEATHEVLSRLTANGFLDCPAGNRARDGLPVGFVVSPAGRTLLRCGCDERYKRELATQWGADEDAAS